MGRSLGHSADSRFARALGGYGNLDGLVLHDGTKRPEISQAHGVRLGQAGEVFQP